MTDHTTLDKRLKSSLTGTLNNLHVATVSAGWDESGWGESAKALVTIISSDFEGMDEGRRQEKVWERILSDLTPDEQERIDYIFTRAPSELDAKDPRRSAPVTK
jgi:hypothetical protein